MSDSQGQRQMGSSRVWGDKAGARLWQVVNATQRDLSFIRYSVGATDRISAEKWKRDLVLTFVAVIMRNGLKLGKMRYGVHSNTVFY